MTDALLMDLEEPYREAEAGPAPGGWWSRLEGLDPVLELPADRPRPRVPGLRRERLAVPLGAGAGWLRRLDLVAARPSSRRTAAVLAAGVAALCARLTGRRDLALGTPVAGGVGRAGLGVLRLELPDDPTFGELLDRTQRRLLEADERGPVPAALAGHDGPAGPSDPARHPLVQVAVAVRGPGEPAVDGAALRLGDEAPPFELLWVLDRSVEPACLVLEHDPELFGAMGRRLTGGLLALLEAAVADPGLRLSALPVVAPEELPAVLREWAVVRTPYPREAGIAELFDRQAAARPDAVAVVDGGRSVTYRELDRRSARLAARLRALGAGRSRPVALALERSLELVEAMLAVVRAGGAYVPLDAAYP
ncbi:MAG TPA: AMP-binding protein, partial [Thermoanaerobaculia bacterium]